jgi:hypothetical protein
MMRMLPVCFRTTSVNEQVEKKVKDKPCRKVLSFKQFEIFND